MHLCASHGLERAQGEDPRMDFDDTAFDAPSGDNQDFGGEESHHDAEDFGEPAEINADEHQFESYAAPAQEDSYAGFEEEPAPAPASSAQVFSTFVEEETPMQ